MSNTKKLIKDLEEARNYYDVERASKPSPEDLILYKERYDLAINHLRSLDDLNFEFPEVVDRRAQG